ncbi:MAG: hypothetical protein EAZ92_12920 [Candidatus Kapaibacterium sp.]|nr:MAG: hypothetical protein EAZ92_12920 [Candidatus Kapabacteria bacterium]
MISLQMHLVRRISTCFSFVCIIFLCTTLLRAQHVSPNDSPESKPSKAKKVSPTKANTPAPAAKNSITYMPYEGKWFGVEYPKGWTVRGGLKNEMSGADDSVFFTAPDSLAEFYVYCPRYTGKPVDIEIDRTKENQTGQTLEEERGVRIRTVRIWAKDSSYVRVIEDTEAFMQRRRLVFAVLFRGNGGRLGAQKYNNAYMYFKQSFRKFSD